MIHPWQLVLISSLYIAILFSLAWYGDRRAAQGKPIHRTALIYSLSLAVYCSSWSFYGAVGQATTDGWMFASIYVGPILFLLFGWKFFYKIIHTVKEKRLTSIADFIGTRYGRDHSVAALVTIVAILIIIPYVALQLKAVSMTFELVSLNATDSSSATVPFWEDTAFHISWIMSLFAIMFGTRNIDASEQHPGMILAVAFESMVKLIALLMISFWTITSLFNGPLDMIERMQLVLPDHPLMNNQMISLAFIVQSVISALAFLCLPRQFHVGAVENASPDHIKTARWLFSSYLVLMLLAIVPITFAGQYFLSNPIFNPDTYVLGLPIALGPEFLAVIAFVGGSSAATGMIIVATIAISSMVSNELVLPTYFRRTRQKHEQQTTENVRTMVLSVRRLVILAIIFLSYAFYRYVGEMATLAAIGLLSFAAAAQLAPALIGGLFWQRANRQGAIAGILGGTLVWFLLLLKPLLFHDYSDDVSITTGLLMLRMDTFTFSAIISLWVNISLFVFFSMVTDASVRERMLASDFTNPEESVDDDFLTQDLNCTVDDVRVVLDRILGYKKTEQFFADFQQLHGFQADTSIASPALLQETEKLLASIIGSSSTRVVLSTLLGGERIHIRDFAFLASEASQASSMSREQLQAALENLQQGVSVVDKNMNITAWNSRYLELFCYPDGFIYAGKPIVDVVTFNAERGIYGEGDISELVERRLRILKDSAPYQLEHKLPNGTVILMQGHPMPDGGFVSSYTDITIHRKAEQTLKEVNLSLEMRVEASSQELATLTNKLIEANNTKTRFLAAAGHDLMQPLNAAKLFASTLSQHSLTTEQQELLSHLEGSLQSAEDVLSVLVEISKLDAGALEPQVRPVQLSTFLKPLKDEFRVLAAEKGLKFRAHTNDYWVLSDPNWLRRIIQNLLSNAVRYTHKGGVLIGCRKRGEQLIIEVWDTGIGIPKSKISEIFREFKRLHTATDSKGLGLGLAIVDRMAKKMNHRIEVDSWENYGSRFRVIVPLTAPQQVIQNNVDTARNANSFSGLKTFVIDNDLEVLKAMNVLLNSWECDVYSCTNMEVARAIPFKPDILLADYQLDNDENGLDVMLALREQFQDDIPGILITANPSPKLEERVKELGFYYLKKPLKPAALRALIRSMTRA